MEKARVHELQEQRLAVEETCRQELLYWVRESEELHKKLADSELQYEMLLKQREAVSAAPSASSSSARTMSLEHLDDCAEVERLAYLTGQLQAKVNASSEQVKVCKVN